jgi:serine phosphatase RsbU (regulator of sigma subunit)
MAVLQVSSRTVQLAAPPKKKPRRLRQEWTAFIGFIVAVSSAGGLFALLAIFIPSDIKFLLLPVFVYLAAMQFQRYNLKIPGFVLNMLLNSTPVYLLLTICLAFVYYGVITGLELLIHQSPVVSHIILITTALTWTIMVADDDPLLAYVLSHPGALEIDRLQLDSPVLQDLKRRAAEMLLPLASQGKLIGLLILGPHLKVEAYTHEERAMLDTLAPQVAPALRVAQMVQEQKGQVRERERIEQELRTAQAIQHAFLPKDVPAFPGWQLAPYYRPAREVGGDFYDFLPFEDGQLGFVIGDVTGKGVPAALVMATVHTMLRTTVQGMTSPGEVLARVNDLLAAEIPAGMFVTCFFMLLDSKSGRLRYANAGHELPYRRHDGSVTELWATGMPLGMMPGSSYEEYEASLAPGEDLLFYSDGLVEAHNPSREMFGFPRLKTLRETHADGASLIDVLLGELKHFTCEGWEQEDDVTLVTLQRMQIP